MEDIRGVKQRFCIYGTDLCQNEHLPHVTRLIRIFFVVAVISQLSPAFGQGHDHDHFDPENPLEEMAKKKKRKFFPGFGKFKRDLRRICDAVEKDGRRLLLHNVFLAHNVRDPNCKACKAIFKDFASSCKPRKKRRRPKPKKKQEEVSDDDEGEGGEEGEESEEEKVAAAEDREPPKQRIPNLEVVDGLSRVMQKIADSEKHIDEGIFAIIRLLEVLRAPDNLSPGAKEYLVTMAAFIESPFREKIQQIQQAEQSSPGSTGMGGGAGVDDLFAF